MTKSSVCRQCGGVVERSAGTCEHCGARISNVFRRLVQVVFIVLLVAIIAAGGSWLWRQVGQQNAKGARKTDDRVAAMIEPSTANPALEIPGVLTVRYREVGDQVEIEMRASGMPILYVDREGDGKVDPSGDGRSFAAYPSGMPCVQRLVEETARCGNVPNSAKVQVSGDRGHWSVVWTIPKREMSAKESGADVVFGVFQEADQRSSYYPDHPFAHVYHFSFSAVQASDEPFGRRRQDGSDQSPMATSARSLQAKATTPNVNLNPLAATNTKARKVPARQYATVAGKTDSLAPDQTLSMPASPAAAPSTSGEIFWSGQIEPSGIINLGSRPDNTEILTGSLPGVPVVIEVFPKNIGVEEEPSPSNNYKGLVLRGPAGQKITVFIRWARVK